MNQALWLCHGKDHYGKVPFPFASRVCLHLVWCDGSEVSPETDQPGLLSVPVWFVLFELFSKFPPTKAAQSQDAVEYMAMARRNPLPWFLGCYYGEKTKPVYMQIQAKIAS